MKTAAASALGEAFARYHAGDFARAGDLALAFATTTAAAEDQRPRVQALLLAATCQDELAEYSAAAATNARAMELAELLPDDAPSRALRIRAQISVGTSHRVLGDYAAAECRLREALSGARAHPRIGNCWSMRSTRSPCCSSIAAASTRPNRCCARPST